MATVDMASGISGGYAPTHWSNVKTPYLVEVTLDFAATLTAKGSALAAADVVQVMDIPAEHLVLAAGMEVTSVLAGGATVATLDLGTGADADAFVDGFDYQGASAGDYGVATATAPIVVGGTADTLDVTVATLTGTLSGGEVRVWALMVDLKDKVSPGIAQLGS